MNGHIAVTTSATLIVCLIALYAVVFSWFRCYRSLFYLYFGLLTTCITSRLAQVYGGDIPALIVIGIGLASNVIFLVRGRKVVFSGQQSPDKFGEFSNTNLVLAIVALFVATPVMYFALQDPVFTIKGDTWPISLPIMMLLIAIPVCQLTIMIAIGQHRKNTPRPTADPVRQVALIQIVVGVFGIAALTPLQYWFFNRGVVVTAVFFASFLVMLTLGILRLRKEPVPLQP